jgi:hypothetical protein
MLKFQNQDYCTINNVIPVLSEVEMPVLSEAEIRLIHIYAYSLLSIRDFGIELQNR